MKLVKFKKKKVIIAALVSLLLTGCTTNGGNNTGTPSVKSTDSFKIGILQHAQHIALDRAREGFEEVLKEEGIDVEYDLVNAQGDLSLASTVPSKFQENEVNLIYAIATPAAQGVKNVTQGSGIPIIFNAVTDPVAAELVDSLEKPGGDITGVSDYFSPKEQLKGFIEAFPEMKVIGALYSTDEANSKVQIEELKEASEELGVEFEFVGVTSVNDVTTAMSSLVNKIDGFFLITDNLAANSATAIGNILAENKIPSYAAEQGPVENGILMTEGIDYEELGREAGRLAIEILVNEKTAGEIPIVQTKVTKKVVNSEVAEKIGLSKDSDIFTGAESVTMSK